MSSYQPALSPSRAADFQTCPLKFRFSMVDRIPDPPGSSAFCGTLVHSVLENIFDAPAAERTLQLAEDLLNKNWVALKETTSDLDKILSDTNEEDFLAEAKSLLEGYFSFENPQLFEPSGRELSLRCVHEGIHLQGKIDRVDINNAGLVRITDYKTGKIPSPNYLDKVRFQVFFYALVYLSQTGILPTSLRLMYLRGQGITWTPTKAEIAAVGDRITAIWNQIEYAADTKDFPPRPSPLCGWCNFQNICPAHGHQPPPPSEAGLARLKRMAVKNN